jgi:hypothetical protein
LDETIAGGGAIGAAGKRVERRETGSVGIYHEYGPVGVRPTVGRRAVKSAVTQLDKTTVGISAVVATREAVKRREASPVGIYREYRSFVACVTTRGTTTNGGAIKAAIASLDEASGINDNVTSGGGEAV